MSACLLVCAWRQRQKDGVEERGRVKQGEKEVHKGKERERCESKEVKFSFKFDGNGRMKTFEKNEREKREKLTEG